MHAEPNQNSLDEFRLELGLLMPPTESAEEGCIPSTDPWHPVWCHDWSITEIHLSTSVLCATVQLRRPSALQSKSSRSQCKEELRTLLRFFANLATEYGLLRPVVGFALLAGCAATEGDGQEEPPWMQDLCRWPGDQNWHRGEFLLFVETDQQEYHDRCLDLLRSAPARWQETEEQPPQQAVHILKRALDLRTQHLQAPDDDGAYLLLKTLQGSVDRKGTDETENPLVAAFYNWLNQKARAIDNYFKVDHPTASSTQPGNTGGKEDASTSDKREPILSQETIARVTKLTAENFRGFGSPQFELDLDADFVLLAGPNGLGKTSLIEALELLLTGYHHFRENPHHLFHGPARKFELTAHVLSVDNTRWSITCTGSRETNGAARLEWTVDENQSWAMERPLTHDYRTRFGVPLTTGILWKTTELLARRTVVYPDRLEKLFDETTQGLTLRDFIEPIPPVVKELLKETHSAIRALEDWRRKLEAERTPPDPGESRDRVNKALQELAKPYEELQNRAQLPPLPLVTTGDKMDGPFVDEKLSEFVGHLAQEVGESAKSEDLPRELPRILETLRRAALRRVSRDEPPTVEAQAIRTLEERLTECERTLKEIATEYPRLDEEVAVFDADDEQFGLLAILEMLGKHTDRWLGLGSKLLPREGPRSLDLVLGELRRVRPRDAAQCAAEIRSYLAPLEKLVEARDHLLGQRERLRVELKRARGSKNAAALVAIRSQLEDAAFALQEAWLTERKNLFAQVRAKDAAGKLEQIDGLTESVRSARALIQEEIEPSKTLQQNVEQLTNSVLSRFVSSEGLHVKLKEQDVRRNEPPDAADDRVRRIYTMKTRDGRARAVLSFGQRTQFGVAMVIAENRLLESRLGHRVFLMDDLSATYDWANLCRDAVFWRQMAYGNGATNERTQRQVFLSSHHEDLSNRLLDAMAPVAGRRALLYRFTGWKLETGPSMDVYEIEPQATLDQEEDRQDFARWMRVQLTETADAIS